MLRDKSLVPLSRQHQHALALCVRIRRASPISQSDLAAWQAEIGQHFRAEIRVHFEAEEQIVFPAARAFSELGPLVEELLSEHAWLRNRFANAQVGGLAAEDIAEFGRRLSAHIRIEERRLFERLQDLMDERERAVMGEKLDLALQTAGQICIVPAESTRKREK